MPSDPARLQDLITSPDPNLRDLALDDACRGFDAEELARQCDQLDAFWRASGNLYHRVRALFFLHALYRYELPARGSTGAAAPIPEAGVRHLWSREFKEAIDVFLAHQQESGPSHGTTSGLAQAYRELAFQTLADQVRHSVRSAEGNAWMFDLSSCDDHPLRLREELCRPSNRTYPVLGEQTPVRMDLSHSGWSDIFFLGMDYPEGARVLNVSIDLALRGRDPTPLPPIVCSLQLVDTPVLRLESVDLEAAVELDSVDALFDFGADYLGLLKAAVVASGLVPAGLEGREESMQRLLEKVVGRGRGLKLSSHVRGIPKGSRLAVSTNLLGSLIALCMRATGQIQALTGELSEEDRRRVAARAILGEWLGGSGGGWQDSAGLWPGFKRIEGVEARAGDPEFGTSRGCLLPRHEIIGRDEVSEQARDRLQESLVLIHGGMAQNVGPILEMVSEKYLLRCEHEWQARQDARAIFDTLGKSLAAGDMRALGRGTTQNFFGPICTIIPWATNAFTEALVANVAAEFGGDYWGFWMLGGMSGGGMGLLFDPLVRDRAADRLPQLMGALKAEYETALPFAMEPVVYDFSVNERGSVSAFVAADHGPASEVPSLGESADFQEATLEERLAEANFDTTFHEELRADLRSGRIGLAANRLPADSRIEDARAADTSPPDSITDEHRTAGERALREGRAAVVTLAAGAGSRWTQGAGVVKALSPFCKIAGKHRSFVDVHLAKARRSAREWGRAPGQIFTTGDLTHAPLQVWLARASQDHPGPLLLSRGRTIGLRFIPCERDLRFLWQERAQVILDEQAQKLRESSQAALIAWAREIGEASDYRDNVASQCLHPVGHWYEVPNLLTSGSLAALLTEQPNLETLLLHNVDTLGVHLDPGWLGLHLAHGDPFSFELVSRQVEDRGGGLARVNGKLRLVESLALPREEDELALSHYSTMTTWIAVDGLLALFGLERGDLVRRARVADAVADMARRMPSYITLKEVKRRWGHGQEDVFPVAQFEKLWGDMSTLPEARAHYFSVSRQRGQQLKDPAQLDGWLRDGSAAHVESLCDWKR